MVIEPSLLRFPVTLLSEIASTLGADSFRKLDPRVQLRNPVMFVVFVGSLLTTILGLMAAFGAVEGVGRPGFVLAIAAWQPQA